MSSLYRELPDGHIRVLTIHPGDETTSLSGVLRSVPLASAPDFEAVSYPWGTEEFTDTLNVVFSTESTSGEKELAGCISTTPNVTSLLRSLRYANEPRVLWIDAICINQANVSERNLQVRQMRHIYSHAQRVIIWLGLATENGESDCAFRFLQRMGTYKKRLDHRDRRYASATSDDISEFSYDGSLTLSDLECGSDIDEDEGPTNALSDFAPDENDRVSWILPDHMQAFDYTPKFIQDHSSELGYLGLDDEGSESLQRTTHTSTHERAEVAVAGDYDFDLMASQVASHVAIGYAECCYMFGHPFDPFFHKRFQRHWAAVDGLLSRPWWSRVWVVQEVWSASDRAILQCGQQTIRWKTFQRAMSYHDTWDDMGEALRRNRNSRAGIWTQLQRRYGLAIHLCKMRLLGGKLSDLLWNTWDRDATDPRDQMFAVLGLVGENTRPQMSPDYGKGVRQVFCEAAREIIRAEGSLDILLAAGGQKGKCHDGMLPSWVPDWRKEANETRPVLFVNRARLTSPYFAHSMDYVRLFGHGYAACAEEKAAASFGNNLTTLHTRAVLIDEIGTWCGIPQGSGPIGVESILDDAGAVAYEALEEGTLYWWMEDEKEKNQCAAGSGHLSVIARLLDMGGKVSTRVAIAAAGNGKNGKEVMELLLDRRGDQITITEELVKAAAGNWFNGKEVIALLLDRRGDQITITEEVVKATVWNGRNGKEVMALLLDRRGDQITITEEVVKAAAWNGKNGKEVMELLLDRRGDQITITEGVVKAAAGNGGNGGQVMKLILDQRGDQITITEGVVKAAAGNGGNGAGVMILLLDRRGDQITITEEVVKAAAGNGGNGECVMRLLLDRRGDQITITEEVVKAAAWNGGNGALMMKLILDQRGDQITITEEVFVTAATCGQDQVLDLLSQKTDCIPLKDEWRRIARFYNAAKAGDVQVIEELLQERVKPDTKNVRGITPLWNAACLGHNAVVKALAHRTDVDVNSRSVWGTSPLFCPASRGDESVVGTLMEAGADPAIMDYNGDTAISTARKNGHERIAKMLERYYGDRLEPAISQFNRPLIDSITDNDRFVLLAVSIIPRISPHKHQRLHEITKQQTDSASPKEAQIQRKSARTRRVGHRPESHTRPAEQDQRFSISRPSAPQNASDGRQPIPGGSSRLRTCMSRSKDRYPAFGKTLSHNPPDPPAQKTLEAARGSEIIDNYLC
ncbi:heterokaryon incompatibility protein [Colletotrichum musicola]|uniref:Heterokaryon incompatibility protein n=1 Tax=Colletotrichum musicola TaxID=2175873 RepID=A0A8H6J6T6_9PEZI|nr:heterokaryon incompatibility protein [Colletotrichum musicola]